MHKKHGDCCRSSHSFLTFLGQSSVFVKYKKNMKTKRKAARDAITWNHWWQIKKVCWSALLFLTSSSDANLKATARPPINRGKIPYLINIGPHGRLKIPDKAAPAAMIAMTIATAMLGPGKCKRSKIRARNANPTPAKVPSCHGALAQNFDCNLQVTNI